MERIKGETEAALKKAAATMKRFYDRSKGQSADYQPGDQVMLENTNLTPLRPMKKLSEKRYGPFKVVKKVGASAYELQVPRTWKGRIHPVFNEVLLSPYHPPKYAGQQQEPPPPPEIVEGTQEYEVEQIVDVKIQRGQWKFLVHWKGYPAEQRTWEPIENLLHAKEAIRKFYHNNPGAPRPLNAAIFNSLRFRPLFQFTEPT